MSTGRSPTWSQWVGIIQAHRIFPIMHAVGIRRMLAERHRAYLAPC
jgi:hypothetical protein